MLTHLFLNPPDLDRTLTFFIFRVGGTLRILYLEAFAHTADHDHIVETERDPLSARVLSYPAPPLLLFDHADTGI
jgi:hypothetical protein